MKLFRPLLLCALAAMLSGCGFHPLYAVPERGGGGTRTAMRDIYVAPVPDKLGYALRNQVIDLIDGTARPGEARYRLNLILNKKSEAIGVQSQKVGTLTQTAITRYNDWISVEYELTDTKTGAVLTKGVEKGLSSYNVFSSPYATLVSQQDADERTADDLADRIRIALAAYFSQQPAQAPNSAPPP
jgi:LPS-assembly lipoprotein